MRDFRGLTIVLLASAIPLTASAQTLAQRELTAYGTGTLLGATAVCDKWDESQRNAASELFIQWVLRDVALSGEQEDLRKAMAKGWKAGHAAAQSGQTDCGVWIDDYSRLRTDLETALGQTPAPR